MTENQILPITLLGRDAVLRSPVEAIPESSDMHELAEKMHESMRAHDGIGLAAPQIDKGLSMFVIDKTLFPEDIQELLPCDTFLNPTLKKNGFKRVPFEEGCLSIPGVFGATRRYKRVTLTAYTLDWKKVVIPAEDLLAFVFQHEVDHLNTTLFVDRADKKTLYKVEGEEARRWYISEVES